MQLPLSRLGLNNSALQPAGIRADQADCGVMVESLRRLSPDHAVITDWRMPRKPGLS